MALFFAVVLAALGVAGLANMIAKRPALDGGRIGAVVGFFRLRPTQDPPLKRAQDESFVAPFSFPLLQQE